jgi:hypothetical protein
MRQCLKEEAIHECLDDYDIFLRHHESARCRSLEHGVLSVLSGLSVP